MSFEYENNIAIASTSDGSQSDNADFNVADALPLTVTKIVDRATDDDTTPLYYNGDPITFTITLERLEGMNSAINQITLTDLIPDVVSILDVTLGPTGVSGDVNVDGQNITISNLVLNSPQPIIIVTVTGTIVYPVV